MFFSADLSANDIARKVRSICIIKDAAHILRKKIKFVLLVSKKKYCDSFDLQDAWANRKIKDNAKTFLAALFNLNEIAINGDDSNKE